MIRSRLLPTAGRLRPRPVLVATALAATTVVPLVGAAPAAHAATSALSPTTSPSGFGNIPVGQLTSQNIQVTNNGTTAAEINVAASDAAGNGLYDYFVGPAYPASPSSCIDQSFNAVPVAPSSSCTLGIYFSPIKFGARNSTTTVYDTAGGSFTLNLTGVGNAGYYIAGSNAEYRTFGTSSADLSSDGMSLKAPVVGIAGREYGNAAFWLAASDGGVFTAGAAKFYGSAGNLRLNKPVVGMAATPSGQGYWLVASDGGIFTYGNAHFYGSAGNLPLNKPIVGMAPTPSGHGYWLVASDGGIFTYGDAHFYGSAGNLPLNKPVVGMASTPDGHGYWLVASDGGIFTYGDAHFYGSAGNLPLVQPVVGMAASPTGHGYWMVARDGGIFTYGDAPFRGSLGGSGVTNAIGMATTTAPLDSGALSAAAASRVSAGLRALRHAAY